MDDNRLPQSQQLPWWLPPLAVAAPIVLVGIASFWFLRLANAALSDYLRMAVPVAAMAILAFALTARFRRRLIQSRPTTKAPRFTTMDLIFWTFVVALVMTLIASVVHFQPQQHNPVPIAPRP
jgi:drug/metabolite transporter (DMT)-like permease